MIISLCILSYIVLLWIDVGFCIHKIFSWELQTIIGQPNYPIINSLVAIHGTVLML